MGGGVIEKTLGEQLPGSGRRDGHQRRYPGTDLRKRTHVSIGSGIEQ
jgi:hypothetical protein